MDSYSGSEPRSFISFRSDNESNVQPLQLNAEMEERMDTSESFVTASSHIEGSSSMSNLQNSQEAMGTAVTVQSVMNTVVGPLIHSEGTGVQEMSQDESPQTLTAGQPEPTATPQSAIGITNMESSSTDESCGAYIARKWEQLGVTPEIGTQGPGGGNVEKSSDSIALELAPTQNLPNQTETDSDSVPRVAFLDPPTNPSKSSLKSMYKPSEPKIQKLCVKIGDTRREFSVSASDTEGPSNTEDCSASGDEFRLDNPHAMILHGSSNRSASDTGQDSAGLVGSKVADALYAPVDKSRLRVSNAGSVTSVDFPEEATKSPQLSASSRVLIKESFEAVSPVTLPPMRAKLTVF